MNKDIVSYKELGFSAIRNKDYQEAMNIFRRALEKKREAESFSGWGIASDQLGDYLTAKWAFYKALELKPKDNEIMGHIRRVEREIEEIKKHPSLSHRQSLFRAKENYLEIFSHGKWNKFFIKGINIGLGLPGYFPGEFPIKKGTYLKWFGQIAELGVNVIRIYAIHPPSFYEALYRFNQSGKNLYLMQGIWVELPEGNDFSNEAYDTYVKENIKNAIDVIYGDVSLPEKPGYAHGPYQHDISPYTLGFLLGREWESCAVKTFNELKTEEVMNFNGEFVSIKGGSPFEVWVAKTCNFLQNYEHEKYKTSHPVSVVNWPTLDPLTHPSESRHEEELLLQGISEKTGRCYENEDEESLDLTKMKTEKGAGFFATYHVYPYYPDFMNHDDLEDDNPYLSYLNALKNHHADQPVLIAEFGMPSSREVTHWQSKGWHHGGHSETKQGEINGLLMKGIYEAGMAGGILFSWFDEWYKWNWLFSPYEIPNERRPLWFNIQNAEKNYGLLAAYPGYPDRKVHLAGQKEDWKDATTLYEKDDHRMIFRYHDRFDDARAFKRLLTQHDEGFLYVLIETKGGIDFEKANYLIGLDTCGSDFGERLLPLKTNTLSPIPLKFLIHLAGKEKSRILVCPCYDRYLSREKKGINPTLSDQGTWVIMLNETNRRRVSKDGNRFYPSHVFSISNLRFGSLDRKNADYHSLADFFVTDNIIELRIPWGLINFTDPSSRLILWKGKEVAAKKTRGIKIIAVSYKPERNLLFAKSTGLKSNITDCFPEKFVQEEVKNYSWKEWNIPVYHTYLKESYFKYQETLSEISMGIQ